MKDTAISHVCRKFPGLTRDLVEAIWDFEIKRGNDLSLAIPELKPLSQAAIDQRHVTPSDTTTP